MKHACPGCAPTPGCRGSLDAFRPRTEGTESDLRTARGGSAEVDDPGAGDAGAARLHFSRVTPNPSHVDATLLFVSPKADEARLTIHDASGRRVAILLDGHAQVGTQAVRWDLRDEGGRRVRAGIHLARLEQGSAVTTTKVVVRR